MMRYISLLTFIVLLVAKKKNHYKRGVQQYDSSVEPYVSKSSNSHLRSRTASPRAKKIYSSKGGSESSSANCGVFYHQNRCARKKRHFCFPKSGRYDYGKCEWVKQCCDQVQSNIDRPNILLITMDDLGYNEVGYLGGDNPTKTIDKLSASGIRLNYHYTDVICSATRSALLTGRYPWKTGVDDLISLPSNQSIDLKYPLISEILNDNGYNTLFAGKWHIGESAMSQLPSRRGFDQSFYNAGGVIEYRRHVRCVFPWDILTLPALFDNELGLNTLDQLNSVLPNGLCPRYDLWFDDHQSFDEFDQNEYIDKLYADEIKDALDNYNKYDYDDPWFIFWSIVTPHFPYEIPPKTTPQCDHVTGDRQVYCNMIYYADLLIEEVVNNLKQNNFYDNTLIIFVSDDGAQIFPPGFGGVGNNLPLRGAKGAVFEGGIRTAAFISGGYLDERYSGCNYNNLVYIADFFPMLLELVGINPNFSPYLDKIDGINLWNDIAKQCDNSYTKSGQLQSREEIISFRVQENEIKRAFIFKNGFKFLLNPIAYHPAVQPIFDITQYYLRNHATFSTIPDDEYYVLFNEFDKNNGNQKLFYSQCYENGDKINIEPLITENGEVYLFKIFEDNIEACNIANDEPEIVQEMMNLLQQNLPIYKGTSNLLRGEKGGYKAISDSYDCNKELFYSVTWSDNPLYQDLSQSWDEILLSYIDQVQQCK